MVTIDLSTPTPEAPSLPSFLDSVPRRIAMTLPELLHAAELAGGAPLPFELHDSSHSSGLEGRLGQSPTTADSQAYADAVASLHDPVESLTKRGLITEQGPDAGLIGAVGLLAKPEFALDIDVAVGTHHVKAWHRQAGDAVATLATADGVVFELAWLHADQWPGELARVAALPDDAFTGITNVPAQLEAPFSLLDAVGEALHSGRHELIATLLSQHPDQVSVEGVALGAAEAGTALSAVHTECRGRLRVLAAHVGADETAEVGVVSWVLLGGSWHSMLPHHDGSGARIHLRAVTPAQLATELAPVLAQVIS